jgi:5-methylcytosine-specific restriction endonuclease McrA
MQKPENAAKSKEWVRAWMMAHPEKRRVYYKEWATENAVVLRAYGKRRQELVAQSDFTFDDWLTTLAAFNHCCAYCLRGDRPLTMDHMNPISRGGLHTADNIIPACRSCNSKKGDRSILLMASKG